MDLKIKLIMFTNMLIDKCMKMMMMTNNDCDKTVMILILIVVVLKMLINEARNRIR